MGRLLGLPLLAIACLGSVIYLNTLMVEVQWEEMDQLLTQSSGEEAVLESASLWGRLELVKNRLRFGETPVENYVLEARIQALTATLETTPDLVKTSWKSDTVNILRKVFGRQLLINREQEAMFKQIEQAYLFERTRKYEKASEIYDSIGKSGQIIPDNIRLRIQLHLGFCLALAGEKIKALEVFSQVVKDFPQSDGVILAALLVDFLQKLEALSETTLGQAPNPTQVRDSYFSMDYEKSLDYFNKLQVQDDAESRYYKGRSHEELGQLDEAQNEFRRVIFLDSEGAWGREARRRLVMQEKVYSQKSELTQEAAKELLARGDQIFVHSLETYPGYIKPPEDPFKTPTIPTGELYVDTSPPGAQIVLNGVRVGISPLFVTDVPVGTLDIEAKLGRKVARAQIVLENRGIRRINLELPTIPGKIQINSPHKIQSIYLNDKEIIDLDKIVPGRHILLIQVKKSNSEIILWENEVTVSEGETLTIEVP